MLLWVGRRVGQGWKARREVRCGSVVLGMGGDRVGDQRRYLSRLVGVRAGQGPPGQRAGWAGPNPNLVGSTRVRLRRALRNWIVEERNKRNFAPGCIALLGHADD